MPELRLYSAIRAAGAGGVTPVIAEIKARSPRDGDLLRGRDPVGLAVEMEEAGAAALSVVTEGVHFGGDLGVLRDVAESVSLPVLRKDFIRAEGQVHESRRAGASGLLLISSMLPLEAVGELDALSRGLGMDTVIEVHDEGEMGAVSTLDPGIIGINNRDISRLETGPGDVGRTELLAPLAPDRSLLVSMSAIACRRDARRAMDAGADAVLVGTALMKASSVEEKLRELKAP